MTNRQEVQVQTRGPDGGNLASTRQGRGATVRIVWAAREGVSGGSHRCAAVSSESEAP